MLRPQHNSCRDIQALDGFWDFQPANGDGREQRFPSGLPQPRKIGVPGSWNEQCLDLYKHFSEGWYQKRFFCSSAWAGRRIFIYFGSVCQNSEVWLNGTPIGKHTGPHLPFEFDITSAVKPGLENLLVVLADGRLHHLALPPAAVSEKDFRAGWGDSYPCVSYDFFPFSGIHRPVTLYTVQKDVHIRDVYVHTQHNVNTATVYIEVEVSTSSQGIVHCVVEDQQASWCLSGECGGSVQIKLPQPRVWDIGKGELYTMTVTLQIDKVVVDTYQVRFGIRNISVTESHFLLNGRPVYFKGFGKHEDFEVVGKGLCHPLIIKDFDLMAWVGANSFRTSHYPYAEEWLDIADERGVLVISETPFVGLGPRLYTKDTLRRAVKVVDEHLRRDRNHPSVIMWSLANEPGSPDGKGVRRRCLDFYRGLVAKARSLDKRPLTYAMHDSPRENPMAKMFDVLCVNKYFGWYEWPGRIDESLDNLVELLESFYTAFKKPILFAEFGADAIAGEHHLPEVMFSEEYQSKIVELQFKKVMTKSWMLGAHVWNFADFKVGQSITRVVCNRKGIFTRSRQPKMVAHTLQRLWTTDKKSSKVVAGKKPPRRSTKLAVRLVKSPGKSAPRTTRPGSRSIKKKKKQG